MRAELSVGGVFMAKFAQQALRNGKNYADTSNDLDRRREYPHWREVAHQCSFRTDDAPPGGCLHRAEVCILISLP